MREKIIYPPWISKKMRKRFDILDFCVNYDGFLYSPRAFNDGWDFQTKAFYYRSIDMGPGRIAKKLNLNVNTLKNKEFLGLITLDYEGKNYKLRDTSSHDWSNQGFYDISLRWHKARYGGSPEINGDDSEIRAKVEMDNELIQILHDIQDMPESTTESNPSDDLYKEYYGDYED